MTNVVCIADPLTDAPTGDVAVTEPEVPEGFAVRGAASANWVVRKVVEARAYADRVRAWAAAEIRRAEHEEQFFLCRYGGQLEGWAREQIAASGGRRRSVALPSGTVGFRAAAPRLLVTDHRLLLSWCHSYLPVAVTVEVKAIGDDARRLLSWRSQNCPCATAVETLAKSAVDEHFRATGECPAGTECAAGEKIFVR